MVVWREVWVVFPASAGMILGDVKNVPIVRGVPRKRGDDPRAAISGFTPMTCSPQARG